ncbi:MAG TPA: response regulator transcription factor [Burkholderiaceae bacterium]|jgi:DNA-binding NarL/FixJ family response regulator|nr:response regulator transcription factor [Burkholderiaceae bacterium]
MATETIVLQVTAVHAPGPQPARRVLLADDHEMVRMAMRAALAPLGSELEWIEAEDAATAQARLAELPAPELALLDLNMPGSRGVEWIAYLRRTWPAVRLVIVSAQEDPGLVRELIALGVAGFIPKSDRAEVILQAVRLILAGGSYVPLRLLEGAGPHPAARDDVLTPRQHEVLECLARGLPNKLIARELGLTEGTVKVHLMAIFKALGARNRTEAVLAAQHRLQRPSP